MLLVEIAMLIYGIVILVKGKFSIGKGKILTDGRARLCGGILISPIPLIFLIALVLAFLMPADTVRAVGTLIGIFITFVALILALVLGNILYKQQEKKP